MTDGKFTGKPNDFEMRSAFPPVPQGLEPPKKPDWLLKAGNRARFDLQFEVDPFEILHDGDIRQKLREACESLDAQVEAYVSNFILAMGITLEDFQKDYVLESFPSSSQIWDNFNLDNQAREYRIERQIRIKRKDKTNGSSE